MLRRVPPFEACGRAMSFSPWGSTGLIEKNFEKIFVINAINLPYQIMIFNKRRDG
jgi:hypothetical protein